MPLWKRTGNFGNVVTASDAVCSDFSSKTFPGQIDLVIRAYNKTAEDCRAIVEHVRTIAETLPNLRGVLLVIDATVAQGGEDSGSTAMHFETAWKHLARDLDLVRGHITVEGDPHQREWTRDLNASYVFLREHSDKNHSLLFASSEASVPPEQMEQLCDALRTHTPFITLRDTPDALSAPMARLRRRYGGRWQDAMPLLSAGYRDRMPSPDSALMMQICDRNTFCLWRGSELSDIGGFDSFCNELGGMEDVHARRVLTALSLSEIPSNSVVIRYEDTRMRNIDDEKLLRKRKQYSEEHRAILRLCMRDPVPTPRERQDFPL